MICLPGESNHIRAVAVDLALNCLAVGAQGVRVQRLQVRPEQPDHQNTIQTGFHSVFKSYSRHFNGILKPPFGTLGSRGSLSPMKRNTSFLKHKSSFFRSSLGHFWIWIWICTWIRIRNPDTLTQLIPSSVWILDPIHMCSADNKFYPIPDPCINYMKNNLSFLTNFGFIRMKISTVTCTSMKGIRTTTPNFYHTNIRK